MGGTFTSQNKVRPGAYLNFVAVENVSVNIGSRGTAIMALPLSWGDTANLIKVQSTDLINGRSLAKIGLTAYDEGAKLVNLVLSNASTLLIYRLNRNGVKATATIGNLTATAKFAGEFGNSLKVAINSKENKFEVLTYANNQQVDKQIVSTIAELVNNDYVEFSGTGALAANAGVELEGGTDGEYTAATEYTTYLNLARTAKWNTMAVVSDGATVNSQVVAFIEDLRINEGKYVQAVVANYNQADSEGIINNVCGCVIDNVQISAEEFNAWIAGATAGATVIGSNTGKIVEGATSIIGAMSNEQIIEALETGKFVLSLNQDGNIKVEKDINSLHTFSLTKSYAFSKNRVIRVLDEIGTSITSMWENTFLGKVSNNADGRNVFKSSIISYLTTLQNIGAIQEFSGNDDVTVVQGENIDAVEAEIKIKPVDSMEYLYMTISVNV